MLQEPDFKTAATDAQAHHGPAGNRLLAMLPPDEFCAVSAALEDCALVTRKILQNAHTLAGHVYFIGDGLVSLTTAAGNGEEVEIALVGCEGIVGAAVALGATTLPWRATVRAPGRAWRMTAPRMAAMMDMNKTFSALVLRYMAVSLFESAQNTACACRHTIAQRIARWLLTCQDRLAVQSVTCTHDYIGQALGVRRAGVTVGLGQFEKLGIIAQKRGAVVVIDRQRLEAQSCDCHGLARLHYQRMLG